MLTQDKQRVAMINNIAYFKKDQLDVLEFKSSKNSMYHFHCRRLEAGEERISVVEGKAEILHRKRVDTVKRETRGPSRGHCCPQGRDRRVGAEVVFGEII